MERYGQQILLPELGVEGQTRLANASVLVAGAGGLGSPASLYLAAAGIGRMILVDSDSVSLSNLHRQILYREDDVGYAKVDKAAHNLQEFRSDVRIELYSCMLADDNAVQLISQADIVLDCTDNFTARYLLNSTCRSLRKPLVYASVSGWEGQLTSFAFDLPDQPCLECLFPEVDDAIPDCNLTGTIGVVPGILGVWQANESLHILLGVSRLTGRLLQFDLLNHEMHAFDYNRNAGCRCCSKPASGDRPTSVSQLTVSDFMTNRQAWHVVDVRPSGAEPVFPDALRLPLEELENRWKECLSDRPILFVCRAGVRSVKAALVLAGKGEKAYSLNGGLEGLRAYKPQKESDQH